MSYCATGSTCRIEPVVCRIAGVPDPVAVDILLLRVGIIDAVVVTVRD